MDHQQTLIEKKKAHEIFFIVGVERDMVECDQRVPCTAATQVPRGAMRLKAFPPIRRGEA